MEGGTSPRLANILTGGQSVGLKGTWFYRGVYIFKWLCIILCHMFLCSISQSGDHNLVTEMLYLIL